MIETHGVMHLKIKKSAFFLDCLISSNIIFKPTSYKVILSLTLSILPLTRHKSLIVFMTDHIHRVFR